MNGEIRDALWNEDVGPATYKDGAYQTALFEQYKLCVEMADRISARRNSANTFFLSLHSGVVTVLAAFAGKLSDTSAWLLFAGLLVLVSVCGSWYALVRSYRLLNGAKYAVIGAMEEKLPAYAYSRAEWKALGEGKDWRRYLPVSHIEQWVPLILALAYTLGFVAVVV